MGTNPPGAPLPPAKDEPSSAVGGWRGLLANPALKKMQGKAWWRAETGLVALALVAGLTSGAISHASRSAYEARLEALFETVDVVVAGRDLAKDTVLGKSLLRPARMLKAGLTANIVQPRNVALILDRRLNIELKAGDPIFLSAAEGATETDRLSDKVPPGKRLFSLRVDAKGAGYGWIKPNDHVDVIAHMSLPNRGTTAFTLMQDVTLVSVGSATIMDGAKQQGGSDVSFFVTPDDFELLAYAEKIGSFSLALRNAKDVTVRDRSRGIDINRFLEDKIVNRASGGGALDVIEGPGRPPVPKKAKEKSE